MDKRNEKDEEKNGWFVEGITPTIQIIGTYDTCDNDDELTSLSNYIMKDVCLCNASVLSVFTCSFQCISRQLPKTSAMLAICRAYSSCLIAEVLIFGQI